MKKKDRQKIKLEDIKKDLIYKVPEDFFAKLPLLIQQKVNSESRTTSIWDYYTKFPWLRIAVLLIVLAGVGWLLLPIKGIENRTVSSHKIEFNKEIVKAATHDKLDDKITPYNKDKSSLQATKPQILANEKYKGRIVSDTLAYANTEELLAGIRPGDIELYLQLEDADSDEMNEDL